MPTFLFDRIIFGPVWSRRLGESLGINLLPLNSKVCNFNCIYCECGLTPLEGNYKGFPSAAQVSENLTIRLSEMKTNGEFLNTITFAGNGEPTLHPEFSRIIDDTLEIRNRIFPKARVAVLSNATLASEEAIFNALSKVDLNILKLDSGIEETAIRINCPRGNFQLDKMVDSLKRFKGSVIIQTLFFRGTYNGHTIDNTTEPEIKAWLGIINLLRPSCVMLYSLARDTAVEGLERITAEELSDIAKRLEKTGIEVQVTP